MPGFPCPLACGGGKLPDAAVEAALPCAPPTLAALPRSLLAELGQSPVFFKPPSPARYTVVTDRAGDGLQVVIDGRRVEGCTAARVRTGSGGHTIVVARVAPTGPPTRRTVLFCHASEVDLAAVVTYYGELFKDASVNLVAFDYSGYGASGGAPSVRGAVADAAAALDWALTTAALTPADLVIYGQSLGTGPATVLAARMPGLAGLVLHAGTTGVLRRRAGNGGDAAATVTHPLSLDWDPHPDEAIPVAGLLVKTICPVLLVHGTEDATNMHAESVALAAVAGDRATLLSAEGYGHDDVEIRCPAYGPALRQFLGRAFEGGAPEVRAEE